MDQNNLQTARQHLFYDRCEALNIGVNRGLYWYHTIDLGNDIITPGVFDFRRHLGAYCFPDRMQGQTVLDVGAANGFFSFEFIRRGALVTATELPSLQELDRFPGQITTDLIYKAEKYSTAYTFQKPENLSTDLLYDLMLREPFDFCSRVLGLYPDRKFVSICNFSTQKLGRDFFDWVFLGDVLLHTIDPLKSLASAAKMCSGTLVIAQHLFETNDHQPILLFTGGEDPKDDFSVWWKPNFEWFRQVLKKLGFRTVKIMGNFSDEFIPNGHSENKTIIHAKR